MQVRQLGRWGPTLQMGPEPATAGRHSLEMASSGAKDSSLVHVISLRGFCSSSGTSDNVPI